MPTLNASTLDILRGFDQVPTLLQLEAALGIRCVCETWRDNSGCEIHRALICFENIENSAFEAGRDAVIFCDDYSSSETVKEKVDAAVAEAKEKAEEQAQEKSDELDTARAEILERDKEIGVLQAHVHKLTQALGQTEAEKITDRETQTWLAAAPDREAEARAKWMSQERVKIREHFAAELERAHAARKAAEDEALAAVGKLRKSKTRAKYEKAAEHAAQEAKDVPPQANRGVCGGSCGEEVDFDTHDRDACAPKVAATPHANAAAITVSGSDIYEAARHLAMQPSGLQAMLEVARAQRPAEFKRKGK